ncbi:MAG TPA: CAP domain-containing protein [Nannocystis sp.]
MSIRRTLSLALVASLALACKRDVSERPGSPETVEPAPASAETPAKRSSRKPPKAEPAASSSKESGRFAGMTAAHNRVRARLKIAPLEWSPELARFAQKWADKLARKGCDLQHRPRTGPDAQRYGENIFAISGAPATADDVVDAWAAEVKFYNAKANRCKGVCGHYTQVVWRNSERVGCGMATCGDDTEVWVCNYDPRGNYNGERPY